MSDVRDRRRARDAGQPAGRGGGAAPRGVEVVEHRHPTDCPVCGDRLLTTRLGCTSCGTEVSGLFTSCSYCGLSEVEEEMLRVFLVSRGNMKELARFLQVSYPTARQRFAELLERMGLADELARRRDDVLRRLAAGEIEVDEAERLLGA